MNYLLRHKDLNPQIKYLFEGRKQKCLLLRQNDKCPLNDNPETTELANKTTRCLEHFLIMN